ncbi:acyl carrier protein [Desulfonauticus submarinus]|uniref:Acyl carrier protein n=2 Tax=Desulfonauticus submarinus TaxID=206665 RepID=A0A1H0FTC6_9BACT|nr:acyl carrier protein [Desulfonauticus submarinus]
MTNKEIIDTVNKALIEEFELDPEQMIPEAHLYEDLGLDSLDTVDMIIVLETAFNFKIKEDEDIKSIQTLQDLYNFIIAKKQIEKNKNKSC